MAQSAQQFVALCQSLVNCPEFGGTLLHQLFKVVTVFSQLLLRPFTGSNVKAGIEYLAFSDRDSPDVDQ